VNTSTRRAKKSKLSLIGYAKYIDGAHKFQPHPQTAQSLTRIPQNSSETVVDNHEVRFDLEHLPRTWEGLENRERLPPIAIISDEVEEEIRTEEGDYRPQRRPRTPSTPSFINAEFWESHTARS
jgi:hypothetical protein